jgi:hypothetical protein
MMGKKFSSEIIKKKWRANYLGQIHLAQFILLENKDCSGRDLLQNKFLLQ